MDRNRTENGQLPHGVGKAVWSAALDATTTLVVLLDSGGRVVRVNSALATALGRAPAEIEGQELGELVETEGAESLRELLSAEASRRRRVTLGLHWRNRADHRPPVLWSFDPLASADDVAPLTIGVGVDLHTAGATGAWPQSPTSEAEATAIGRLIRPLVEHSSDVVCVLSADGLITYISPPVQRMLGYQPENLIGTVAFAVIHEEDRDLAAAVVRQGLEEPGRSHTVVCRLRHADGEWRSVAATGVTHREEAGTWVVLNLTDITDWERARQERAESEERFRNAFDHSVIGKILWDPDGRVVRVNRALCDLLSYDEAEMLTMTWRDQVHPDDAENVVRQVRQLVGGEVPALQLEARLRHHDGPWVWTRATVSVARNAAAEPRHFIGEVEDLTERRRQEADKRARLLRTQRQQAAIITMATQPAMAAGERDGAFRTITESSATALRVNRVGVWLLGEDDHSLHCVDCFDLRTGDHTSGATLDLESCPLYLEALDAGRVIDADDAVGDPRTREHAAEYLEPQGVASLLDAPVRIGGKVVGAVRFEQLGEGRIWAADEITFAGEVSDQVAHAMANAQRTRAERRLQMSEERFRSIVNCSPMGVHLYRLEGDGALVFAGANPAADAILGIECQKLIGKPMEEAFPSLAGTEVPERYRRVAAVGTPWHIEQVEYEDERIRGAYEVHAFRTAPGTVTAMFLNITDRKRAEEALRDSEERYRQLFERNLAAVFRASLDGRVLECNDAFAEILGCTSRSEALSRNAADFAAGTAGRNGWMQDLRTHGELRNQEIVMRRLNGDMVWLLANMTLVADVRGRPTIIEGTMIDVTDRKRTADRLLLQSAALESAANAIAITSPGGTIEWVNPAFTRLTGVLAAEAIGNSLWRLKSGGEGSSLSDEVSRALTEGRAWHGELVNRRADGQLYTEEITITPVHGNDGKVTHLVSVQQDITERKRMEEQLLQAQKMEAVGRLAGGVAHDFNNLLQAMLGVTELIRQPETSPEDSGPKLQELEELVQRGSQLTRQLLLFARRDTSKQESLDLNQVVEGTVKLLHRLLRENIELVFNPATSDLPLTADRGQIEQVVMNLAVNACDAMPHGGKLSLTTNRGNGNVWLEVGDTGEGIPEDIRDQLFEPFFTTKERGKGTGLGLSVVHGIVTRLGGRIDLESQVGSGTSIRVTFPASHLGERHAPEREEREPIGDGQGQTILVVEDDPAVRTSLEEILAVMGYGVVAVGSREAAFAIPAEESFELLLSDYILPDGSGTDIARELRRRWPGIGVIVMSGYAQDDTVGREIARGNLYFLQKPFTAKTLAKAVRTVLGSRSSALPADDRRRPSVG